MPAVRVADPDPIVVGESDPALEVAAADRIAGRDGRPQEVEGNQPTPAGTKTCPAVRGATNWYSTAYNPAAKLFYVMAVEDCNIYRQSASGGYVLMSDPVGEYSLEEAIRKFSALPA